MGLFAQFGEFSETSLFLTDIDRWIFSRPIFIGNRIHLLMRIASTSLTKSGAAIVNRDIELSDENSQTVQEGSMDIFIAR